ncbi:sulfite exporter TauE/SafE family protein [Candidatus Saccharibacteria bacterium]|nr:sulfite exporter TauE/SafE family protein [Candidatus Saccharibacteria bacterium]
MGELIKVIFSFVGGIGAGYIGAITSGGGLLSIPLLLFLGQSPSQAIATNRLGSFGLSLATIAKYHKAGKINWRKAWLLTPIAMLGGYIGAHILISINTRVLSLVVASLLLFILPFVIFNKTTGIESVQVSKKREFLGYISFFVIMIYGGFFGGGSGFS